MSIHVALHHVTRYTYERAIQLGPQVVRLRPAPHSRTRILSYSLKVTPAEHFINWQQDPFANYQARLVFPEKTARFDIAVDLIAEMAVYNPFDFFLEPEAETIPLNYAPDVAEELSPYLSTDPKLARAPRFQSYLGAVDRRPRRTIDFLVDINQRLQQDIRYLIRLEPGIQAPEETLRSASGSCRDSAWLLVQLLRHLGLAARFVSGYLIQLTPDVKPLEGPAGAATDFTDLHAWCEVYLPGAGWVGLDPTSGLLAGEGHIPLACTPQPSGAAPIQGMIESCETQFAHTMTVTRVLESPRVTKPYTEAQWQSILALGDTVDERLVSSDVRLTMGGEPTFVAASDRDAPEWNTEALGPTKREFASDLVRRLGQRYAPGGFLHCGQGKWYPGEQLPRWALSLYWRTDGEPVWHDPLLLADEREAARITADDAQRFIHLLTEKLELDPSFIQAGFEDCWYYLWRERRLPINVDPFDARLEDELERTRLRRVFNQQLDSVVGYVLPLAARETSEPGPRWRTGPWFLRDERLYLIPGDSPMGYRLPLDSLPWARQTDQQTVFAEDPFASRQPLPKASTLRTQIPRAASESKSVSAPASTSTSASDPQRAPERFESAHWITRTALVVEARDPMRANGPSAERQHGGKSSHLYVFMPPLQRLEDYLCLLNAIEESAAQLQMRVVLEGYPPPRDPRLRMLQLTPDPGVIEVNIHPARNWKELVDHTEFLYAAAFETGLSAEKFMTDGRHTGTGGGNHLVLGGTTPQDSPFLRRPDLLASLILYWHNHPSLSYLFSGLFIGPTSQAPRVDEARNDQVYELAIALREIAAARSRLGHEPPPWLIDRLLRNILVDVTGNTHRSEFCIDKLYSPDAATGRLGLLELRAFEMPPHARMSVVQQLLLRALVARFWETPCQGALTRWGTELHDRFMMHHWVRQDFRDVLSELNTAGFPFDPSWFDPHLEFRFPKVGDLHVGGVALTLRQALEPWHVMGEENTNGGTARYVDSSLERIEIHAQGINPSRHAVSVNGRTLPLQPTGTSGEFVGSVRYKAWSPVSSLHPTIGVHAPLTIDVIDTWMNRPLGGCQYHVTHPGGRNYDSFPVNAYEAESRRLARFFRMGHSPGSLPDNTVRTTNAMPASPEFPFTLDLRTAPR